MIIDPRTHVERFWWMEGDGWTFRAGLYRQPPGPWLLEIRIAPTWEEKGARYWVRRGDDATSGSGVKLVGVLHQFADQVRADDPESTDLQTVYVNGGMAKAMELAPAHFGFAVTLAREPAEA